MRDGGAQGSCAAGLIQARTDGKPDGDDVLGAPADVHEVGVDARELAGGDGAEPLEPGGDDLGGAGAEERLGEAEQRGRLEHRLDGRRPGDVLPGEEPDGLRAGSGAALVGSRARTGE